AVSSASLARTLGKNDSRQDGLRNTVTAIRQSAIDHRYAFIDAAADGRDDAFDHTHQRIRADEACGDGREQAIAFNVDLARAVHHDLADAVVMQVGLDRAVAHDLGGHLLHERW